MVAEPGNGGGADHSFKTLRWWGPQGEIDSPLKWGCPPLGENAALFYSNCAPFLHVLVNVVTDENV